MLKRRTPCAIQKSIWGARKRRPATGAIGLGEDRATALRRRVPSPPAKMTLWYALVSQAALTDLQDRHRSRRRAGRKVADV